MKSVKSIFDFFSALILLIILFIPLIIFCFIATIDTGQSGLFVQKRIGKNGEIFNILKIRTMEGVYASAVTTNAMKITSFGRFLRKYKLDELPQLINIVKGEMSWVGPRPDVQGYADVLTGDDRIILSVRPGITGPAQIKYRNEEKILSQFENPQQYNDEVLWKDKVEINKNYVKNWNFWQDFKYLWGTVFH
ncbi:MAG: sugar transferase [Flavobacteriaceae bacterium]|jgi:lipopolysaccharide/colanic/teichoic acid biosynthesis glycosyltransferase|nr:sugar transferase [Flavobacteriaceae bacterium]